MDMVDKYWVEEDGVRICVHHNWTCDAVILGLLLKGLKRVHLWPLPNEPYPGLAIAEIICKLLTLWLSASVFNVSHSTVDVANIRDGTTLILNHRQNPVSSQTCKESFRIYEKLWSCKILWRTISVLCLVLQVFQTIRANARTTTGKA